MWFAVDVSRKERAQNDPDNESEAQWLYVKITVNDSVF
jgi:hypothetical protein